MVGAGAGARPFLSKADRHVALTLRDEIDVELENLRLSTVTDAVADFGLLAAFTCRHGSVRGGGGNSDFDRGVGLGWPSDLAARVELRRSHP